MLEKGLKIIQYVKILNFKGNLKNLLVKVFFPIENHGHNIWKNIKKNQAKIDNSRQL